MDIVVCIWILLYVYVNIKMQIQKPHPHHINIMSCFNLIMILRCVHVGMRPANETMTWLRVTCHQSSQEENVLWQLVLPPGVAKEDHLGQSPVHPMNATRTVGIEHVWLQVTHNQRAAGILRPPVEPHPGRGAPARLSCDTERITQTKPNVLLFSGQ